MAAKTTKAIKLKEIYDLCNDISPFDTQESWDKSGLNLGSFDDEIFHIVVCLELTLDIAKNLQPHTLVITHHPLIFTPLTQIHTQSYPSNLIGILLRKNCALISLHTNFDKSHLNAYLTHKILQWKHFKAQDFFMYGEIEPTSLKSLALQVGKKLQAKAVSYTQGDDIYGDRQKSNSLESIKEVYVVCGSGCSLLSLIPQKPQTCLITGDIKHHDAMIAKSNGFSLIDMGHYESEKYFVEIFESILQNAGYNAIIADCKNPFYFCSIID